MEFAKRMKNFGEGVFARLAAVKRQKLEKNEEVIDLSIGAPNIPPSKEIMKEIADSSLDPKNYVYALGDKKELLQSVSKWYKTRYNVDLDEETEICSLLGSQDGLAHISLCLIDEGDLTLVPDPCYPIFADGPRLAGSKIYYMPQKEENNYLIKISDIPKDIAQKAKFMIISYPNNPTTSLAPDSFYEEVIAFAKENDIIVLHDNAYSDLVFDGNKCGSFLRFKGAKEVGIEFNSLSKTYGLAGARIGFCVGNREIISRLKALKSNLDYGMFLPIQKAAIKAIMGDQALVKSTCMAYQKRRDILCDGLISIGWNIKKPEGTMFVWAKLPKGYTNSENFAMELVEKTGVLVTPGSAFGPSGEGYVRMALVQDDDVLNKAVKNIEKSDILK